MCPHVFCLRCILKSFADRWKDTYLEECPQCGTTIFGVPRRDVGFNAITSRLRSERGMEVAPAEGPCPGNPFDLYQI